MKKLFLVALAAVVLASCVQNEELAVAGSTTAIAFGDSFVYNATKADPTTTTATIDNFDVWAFMDEVGGTVLTDEDVTKNASGAWGYQNLQYWAPNHTYYFAALSPANSANVTEDLAEGDAAKLGLGEITFTNVEGTEDLLYAKAKETTGTMAELAAEGMDPVKMQFQHLLSKVTFTFQNGFATNNMKVVVTNVRMSAPKSATIDLAQANYATAWELGTEAIELAFGNAAGEQLAAGASASTVDTRLTIPASSAYEYTVTFNVEVYSGSVLAFSETDKQATIKGYALEMGKAYNFTAVINADSFGLQPIEFTAEVDEWSTENPGDVEIPAVAGTANELKDAIANNEDHIVVMSEIDLAEVVLSGYNGTIIGGEGAVLNTTNFTPSADEAYQLRSQNLTFKNLTIKLPTAGNWLQSGFVGTGVIVFENCKFIGQATLNGAAEWTFNDCEFVSTEKGAYASFVYGAKKATFNRCSFSGVDRAAKVYGTGGVLNVEYNNCTYASSTLNKNGVEIDGSYATTTVGLNNCSQSAMAGLYAAEGNKVTVYVDGEAVAVAGLTTVNGYSKLFVNADKSEYTVYSAEGLIQLHDYWAANAYSNHMWGKTYSIGADIDATGHTWNSVFVIVGNNANNGFVIDGKGHTISNLAINGSLFTGTPNGSLAGTTPGVVRNLTFDNATVANGGYGAAVIWGNTYGEITFEDVHIVNSSVTGVCNVAAFVGATTIEDGGTINPVKFIDCSVEKCTITAIGGDGCDPTGASGYVGRAFAKTSIVFEGTNTIDAATTLNSADGLVGGRVYGYTTWANGGFSGTGVCDEFVNWNGLN